MKTIISKYLRRVISGIEITEERHGIKDNPVLKEVVPRTQEEQDNLQDMMSSKKNKKILLEDRKVEHEKVETKTPDIKPSRKENTTGDWEYKEKRRQYQEEYRNDGKEKYLKKKINPETDNRFKDKGD
jgi:hypothetical protein